MSINGLQQQYFANSLDGLTYLDVNGLAINGNDIDIDNLVPYTGADKAVDVGVQPIRTSYIPIVNNDVVNLLALNQTTTGTVGYVDQYYVPYNGAISDTNLGNKAFTVGIAGNTNLSGLVKTELNRVLAGYTPATIVVGNGFGTITNAGGVYQSTSTGPTSFASLFLGSVVVGEKYSISLSLKCVDPNYNTNIYIYEASLPNFTAGGLSLLSFNIPINTTGFTVFTGTFTPTTYTNLILVFNTQIVTGINTLYWNAFSLTGMGSVVKNLIAPTTTLDGANKGYVDTADALRVPYTGATGNVNLGSNSIIATTAQFTGVTSATPSLALGVDGSGNLRSFAVPVAVNLLPLNNVWTGVNYHNDQVIFNANVGAFGGQFQIDGYDLGYTGSSLTASTGASISFSSPTWTCSTVSSRTALITFNVASYIGKYIKCTWTNVAPVTLFVSPYPYFVVSNNGTTVYSSPQPMTGTAVNYTFSFRPTTAITNILITVQATGTPSVPAVQWTGFAIIEVDTTISNARFNGNVGVGTTAPSALLHIYGSSTVGDRDSSLRVSTQRAGLYLASLGAGGTDWNIWSTLTGESPGAGALAFYNQTSGAFRMVIDSAGKIGMGTVTPAEKLTVQTATENYGLIHTDGTVSVGTYCSSTNGGYVGTKSNHKLNFMTNNGVARLTIDTAGNVGIGTMSPSAVLSISSTTADYTNSLVVNTPWPSIQLNGAGTTGRTWTLLNGGAGAGVGQGNLGIYDSTAGAYRLSINSSGFVGIGRDTPAYKLDINGNQRVYNQPNANDSMTVYGPNATWSSYLVVGSGTDRAGASTAQVISTNGNLHLDGGNSNDIYYGYYANSRGTPNPHRWFGGNYIWDSVPQNTSIYSQPVLFDGSTFRRSQCVAKAVYNSNSVAWGGGVNMTYAFYNYNTAVQVVLTGRYSGYWTSAVQCEFIVRIYNQSSGAYSYYQLNTFTNNAYNHVSMPLNLHIGNTGAGWNDIYVYVNYGMVTDGNDHLQVNALTFPVSSY